MISLASIRSTPMSTQTISDDDSRCPPKGRGLRCAGPGCSIARVQALRCWGPLVYLVPAAVLLVMLVAASGCRGHSTDSASAVYEDDDLRVTVPKGWYLLRSVRGGVVMRPGGVPISGRGPVVAVLTERLPVTEELPLDEGTKLFVRLSEEAAVDASSGQTRRESIRLADREVDALVITRKSDGVLVRLAVVPAGEHVFSIIVHDTTPELGDTIRGVLSGLMLKRGP